MKAFAWIVAGIGVGVAAYIVLNQPGPMDPTGDEDVEYAAGRTTFWGSKQRVSGGVNRFKGTLKEGLGRATGDDAMESEGVVEQLAGAAKDTAGKIAQSAGQALHDINSTP